MVSDDKSYFVGYNCCLMLVALSVMNLLFLVCSVLGFASHKHCYLLKSLVVWSSMDDACLSQLSCRPEISDLESKLSELSKKLLTLQQNVDDLASKVCCFSKEKQLIIVFLKNECFW